MHEKFVWSDGTRLFWRNAVGQKDERSLLLQHITRIAPGQVTSAFRRRARPGDIESSFSVITADRSLDLVVVTGSVNPVHVRDEFIDALRNAAIAAGAKLKS